jgi:L-cysteine desulfidase
VPDARDILIRAKVCNKSVEATALILGSRDHLVGVERNGKPYHGVPTSDDDFWNQAEQINNLKYQTFIEFAQRMDMKDFPILRQAMEINMRFAIEARKETPSLRIGQLMERYGDPGETGEGLSGRAQFISALAVEASVVNLTLLCIWHIFPKSFRQERSIQKPVNFGCNSQDSL